MIEEENQQSEKQIQQNINIDWKKNVAYYYDSKIGSFSYGNGHPMKPLRVTMTHDLIKAYGLSNDLALYDYEYVSQYMLQQNESIFTNFHSDEYIDILKVVTPSNKKQYEDQLYKYNFGEDCPIMERLYDFCLTYTSGSISAASLIRDKKVQYGINWSGGLHHAKQNEASGFCYTNDCVLAILELLKTYQRVCYIDIDIHHGDGVEEAFYTTDRVLTCSFHKFKDYFPGTGSIDDVGKEKGLYHSVNFPLNEGMDDQSYENIFRPVVKQIFDIYKPEAILMQCGTDSLSGDRLGCFNLSVNGHGNCVQYVKSFGVPILLVGGGGYTLRNTPRCWTNETSIICNKTISNQLPEHNYLHYFGPEYKLNVPVSNMDNLNSKQYLEQMKVKIMENIKKVNSGTVQISNYNEKNGHPIVDTSEVISVLKDKKEDMQEEKNSQSKKLNQQ
eukprot:TRINITY_DN26573_c0_g1_i1.p1 TRINITY_DN26573_c0_g1~~TRINITY_DN26573_c0_g1_i1.p1  ORF type:complete len:444 (+),score=63.19 TRINITY_DN26573_c0_g1_i1:191-1522(+)